MNTFWKWQERGKGLGNCNEYKREIIRALVKKPSIMTLAMEDAVNTKNCRERWDSVIRLLNSLYGMV